MKLNMIVRNCNRMKILFDYLVGRQKTEDGRTPDFQLFLDISEAFLSLLVRKRIHIILKKPRQSFILLLLFLLVQTAHAQQFDTSKFNKLRKADKIGISLGPSFLYGDNTGEMRNLKFKILPSIGVSHTKNISTYLDLKSTLGWQFISSGSIDGVQFINRISRGEDPFKFSGSLLAFDITPLLYINPDRNGFSPSRFKFYVASGLGFFYSLRKDQRKIGQNGSFLIEKYSASNIGLYFPFRIGMHTKFQDGDLGFEAIMLVSPFHNIDGVSSQYKQIKADIASQLQVYYRFPIKI
jgi:hypothetical protein